MPKFRIMVVVCLLAGVSIISPAQTVQSQEAEQVSNTEQAIWNLEHSYWQFVQDNNLAAYRSLWHKSFVGWPSVSAEPVGTEHITDWITSQTAKGLAFKSGEFKPARVQVTGDIAAVYYRITFRWLDKDGHGDAHTLRITHTWVKDGKDWKILAGMSMPEPLPPQN
jgi:ketosteroid isomerase-like protein